MIAPEFMDWFLARTAVSGQDTKRLVQPERRDNLAEPVTDLHRTRGSFDDGAKNHAAVYPGAATRAAIVGTGAAVFFALGLLAAPKPNRPPRAAYWLTRRGGRKILR